MRQKGPFVAHRTSIYNLRCARGPQSHRTQRNAKDGVQNGVKMGAVGPPHCTQTPKTEGGKNNKKTAQHVVGGCVATPPGQFPARIRRQRRAIVDLPAAANRAKRDPKTTLRSAAGRPDLGKVRNESEKVAATVRCAGGSPEEIQLLLETTSDRRRIK